MAIAAVPYVAVASATRLELIGRAQLWNPTNVASMNIREGPQDGRGFQPGDTVTCDYTPHPRAGNTPKFHCALPNGDLVKVKYGAHNGEVYAEVLATRLLWALGFGADGQYPVTVICRGCSSDPWREPQPVHGTRTFDPATIERPFVGQTIETHDGSGWRWQELDVVDEGNGGAPQAHRDALKLLAVLLQHTDSKAQQQRLVCVDAACQHPFMYVHDVGLTFGGANRLNRNSIGSVNFDEWSKASIWKDPDACIGNLNKSATGTLDNPRISEAGRAFLASLLVQLTDQQVRDLFEVARVERRSTKTSIDAWVAAFKQKRDEIVNHRCPA